MGVNSTISNSILSNSTSRNSAQNLALKHNFISNSSTSTSIIATPTSFSLADSYASLLNASTSFNRSAVVPLSSVYSSCTSSSIVGRTFASQQEFSAAVSAAAAAQQQQLRKDAGKIYFLIKFNISLSCFELVFFYANNFVF